jgi:hypothetical protein
MVQAPQDPLLLRRLEIFSQVRSSQCRNTVRPSAQHPHLSNWPQPCTHVRSAEPGLSGRPPTTYIRSHASSWPSTPRASIIRMARVPLALRLLAGSHAQGHDPSLHRSQREGRDIRGPMLVRTLETRQLQLESGGGNIRRPIRVHPEGRGVFEGGRGPYVGGVPPIVRNCPADPTLPSGPALYGRRGGGAFPCAAPLVAVGPAAAHGPNAQWPGSLHAPPPPPPHAASHTPLCSCIPSATLTTHTLQRKLSHTHHFSQPDSESQEDFLTPSYPCHDGRGSRVPRTNNK